MKKNEYTKTCNYPADALKIPESPDLERAVLGALMVFPESVADVRGILTSTAFYDPQNARIYDAICKLDDRGIFPDLYQVFEELKGTDISRQYLAVLTQAVGSGVGILNHARILVDKDIQRRGIFTLMEGIATIQEGPEGVMRVISSLERITGDVARIASARSIGDVMQDTLTALERRQQAHQRGECVGISTGLPCMDRITGGWRGGQLVILAARPAMGKTARCASFRTSCSRGRCSGMYLFAGDARDAARRPYAGWCFGCGCEGVPVWCGKYRGLEAHRTGSGPVGRVAVTIIDTPSISMPAIRAQCRVLQRQGRCGMVVIDYLQLTAPDSDKRNNREREVAEMSRAAKVLAKELDVPVILLSQLSRKVEERADKTPILADLRESGAIEQDADMVIFIDRPAIREEEMIDTTKYGKIPSEGVGVFYIAKNREGATGSTYFRHNESLTRITDYDTTPSTPTDGQNGPF